MDDPALKAEVPLAVVGIVPCKVTDENGPVQRGDLLVTSSKAGYAMKGTDHNRMLGLLSARRLSLLRQGMGSLRFLSPCNESWNIS